MVGVRISHQGFKKTKIASSLTDAGQYLFPYLGCLCNKSKTLGFRHKSNPRDYWTIPDSSRRVSILFDHPNRRSTNS